MQGAADLRGAKLQGRTCGAPTCKGADLRGANLQGADLFDANLEAAKLTNAKFDENTTLPDGSEWTPDTDPDLVRFTDPNHHDFWPSSYWGDNDQPDE